MDNKEFLIKYASYAEQLLSEEYGADYTSEDVEKLASALIDEDLAAIEAAEVVEEIVKVAQAQAAGFAEEFLKDYSLEDLEKVAKVLDTAKNLLNKTIESGQKMYAASKDKAVAAGKSMAEIFSTGYAKSKDKAVAAGKSIAETFSKGYDAAGSGLRKAKGAASGAYNATKDEISAARNFIKENPKASAVIFAAGAAGGTGATAALKD